MRTFGIGVGWIAYSALRRALLARHRFAITCRARVRVRGFDSLAFAGVGMPL